MFGTRHLLCGTCLARRSTPSSGTPCQARPYNPPASSSSGVSPPSVALVLIGAGTTRGPFAATRLGLRRGMVARTGVEPASLGHEPNVMPFHYLAVWTRTGLLGWDHMQLYPILFSCFLITSNGNPGAKAPILDLGRLWYPYPQPEARFARGARDAHDRPPVSLGRL